MVHRAMVVLLASLSILWGVSTSAAAGAEQVIRAGMAFHTDSGGQCVTGFSVRHATLGDGFLAFRGCGEVGDVAYLYPSVRVGVVAAVAASPTWLWVDLDDGWSAAGELADGSPIEGGAEAPVGASVCRSGSTSGWHCGVIQAKNVTISFPQGTINGVTRTNVCVEPGDVGAVYISATQAQGIGIGGSGSCSSGGASYFYPLSRVLSEAPGLSLITS